MGCSLLIVEDDPSQRDTLTRWFSQRGFRVASRSHPRQALEMAKSKEFQVALLDLSLPDMDGIELMQRLKRIQHSMQVIILSGYDYPMRRARMDGAFTVLTKPCSLKELEETVEAATERMVEELMVP